jgi:hypothetical protein
MDSIKSVLKNFNPVKDKYVSREFQSYGVHLAETLNDYKHKALYIKMSRDIPRAILDKALTFCVDSNAKNKGALFMWKLKEMGVWKSKAKSKPKQPSIE